MCDGCDYMLPINQSVSNYTNSAINGNRMEPREYTVGNGSQKTNGSGATYTGQVPQNFIVPKEDRLQRLQQSFDDKSLKQMGVVECQTCANRVYQDGSNDPGVSFKAPTHLSPNQAASAVASHEQEHVSNEQAKAKSEDREIVSQSVQIFTSVCPECSKSYVSGGVTKTTTRSAEKSQATSAYQMAAGLSKAASSEGNLLDYKL